MTMSEYEERFRSSTPSLYQTLVMTRGPNRGRRWSRRLWVAATLVGVMTTPCKISSHHTVHSGTGKLALNHPGQFQVSAAQRNCGDMAY
jgi:hypothetical protein